MDADWLSLQRAPSNEVGAPTELVHVTLLPNVASVVQSVYPSSGDPRSLLLMRDLEGLFARIAISADAWIIFGPQSTMAAPVVGSSWPIYAKAPQEFLCTFRTRYFRVISVGGGEMSWYRG